MFNVRSLRSKFDEFQCHVALERPDIICITETWVSESFNGDILGDFELQGYNHVLTLQRIQTGRQSDGICE